MSFSKVSTLTSGVLAIANNAMINNKENIVLDSVNSYPGNVENILVIDKNFNDIANYDDLIESIYQMGFRIIISDTFTNIFTAKAISYGILTIEVTRAFIDKLVDLSKSSSIKLFVDVQGQEVMIINSGEKEFFELSDYCKENLDSGRDDVENLYSVWDDMHNYYKKEEVFDYAIE